MVGKSDMARIRKEQIVNTYSRLSSKGDGKERIVKYLDQGGVTMLTSHFQSNGRVRETWPIQ